MTAMFIDVTEIAATHAPLGGPRSGHESHGVHRGSIPHSWLR
jgi:hypothetical protein